ncbi:hypothetical protein P3575_24320, partial [Vibrio parahaemolyticus]|nr:hypothetical protein [Vibrio parahaemolyticus]
SGTATLRHILSGCKVSLSQGRYTWRHNQVLKCLAASIERKRRQVNSEGVKDRSLEIQFVREGEKYRRDKLVRRQGCGRLEHAYDLDMQVDLGGKLVVPQEIVCPSRGLT